MHDVEPILLYYVREFKVSGMKTILNNLEKALHLVQRVDTTHPKRARADGEKKKYD